MTKFDRELNERDKVIKEGDLELIVPFSSFVYLIGVKIDFSDDLLNGGFKFSNPQANRTCGCGTSFSV
jgi:iron-sulfur cluster assembly protein